MVSKIGFPVRIPFPKFSYQILSALTSVVLSGIIIFHLPALSSRRIPIGLWAECQGQNQTLDSKEKIEQMIELASTSGINEIFLQVYRGNRSWYNSDIVDDMPYQKAMASQGYDPLKYALKLAKGKGIKIYAWVNVFSLSTNKDALILKELGASSIIRDSRRRSMLEYENFRIPGEDGERFRLDSQGYWLDPANLEARRYLLRVFKELLLNYPQLEGIHLDYIRYPYCLPLEPLSGSSARIDFGYAEESIERFKKEKEVKSFPSKTTLDGYKWDEWRREQITSMVEEIFLQTKGINPKFKVNAAVLCWPDRAYLMAFQDWRKWLEKGIVDFVVSMNYSRDEQLVNYLTKEALAFRGKGKVFIGHGAYAMLDDPSKLLRQIRNSQKLGVDGIVLFSYDNILKRPQLFEFLAYSIKDEK